MLKNDKIRMSIHQGDILLRPIDKIPSEAKKIREEIVAFGEVTGHTHRIKNSSIYGLDNKEFVRVHTYDPMTHDTHPSSDKIEIGDYETLRQFEYFPTGELIAKD